MDALALLCNLYGDGPATLRRLREAGCTSFTSLESIPAEDLALILGTSPVGAQRFQREARHLLDRVGDVLEQSRAITASDIVREAPSAPPRDAALERALAVWRTWDESGESVTAAGAEQRDERRAPEPQGRALVPDLVDGLDSEWCLRLREFGIESAEELASCDALELARAMEAPLTRLMRLQALARRLILGEGGTLAASMPATVSMRFSPDPLAEVQELEESEEEAEDAEVAPPSELEESEGTPEEASGPFA